MGFFAGQDGLYRLIIAQNQLLRAHTCLAFGSQLRAVHRFRAHPAAKTLIPPVRQLCGCGLAPPSNPAHANLSPPGRVFHVAPLRSFVKTKKQKNRRD